MCQNYGLDALILADEFSCSGTSLQPYQFYAFLHAAFIYNGF